MMKRMIAVAATLVLTATAAFAAAENYTVGIGPGSPSTALWITAAPVLSKD